jgi:ATPase subunit of ABC transporter with duplicated ATPase domains
MHFVSVHDKRLHAACHVVLCVLLLQVGYLPQEPQLEDGATVGENIESAVKDIRGLLTEYNDISVQAS